MDSKSEEFTGELFTKSETNSVDLISMMSDIQEEYVHTFTDQEGNIKVYEKKILSGDNKTEKNQTYGIIRLICDEIVYLDTEKELEQRWVLHIFSSWVKIKLPR